MTTHLFLYQCRVDATTAVAARKASYGDAYRCVLCRSYMTYRYAIPIETDEHRGWAARGIVYNPRIGTDPQPGSLREIPS